jgi:hypothetical protein
MICGILIETGNLAVVIDGHANSVGGAGNIENGETLRRDDRGESYEENRLKKQGCGLSLVLSFHVTSFLGCRELIAYASLQASPGSA